MENKKFFELTNPQKSIWYTEQYYNGTTVNNICTSGTVYGKIDENLLKQAINNVVKQNDSFRIRVVLDNNIAKQYIAEYKEFNIDVEYINDESQIESIEKDEVKYKFEVIDSDLFKFKLAISRNNFACIILTVNHLIADSWSLGLVIQEILRNYNSLKINEEITQETFSYVDYINSEKEYKASKKFENDKAYWSEIFETIPEQATIPSLNNSIKDLSYNANRLSFEINKDLLSRINVFCRENNISIFNFFMAIFSIYIGRVSNIDDFVIGTPILNRSNFKEKHTTGMFVNTVPVRVNNLNDGSFKNLASNFATKMMGILRHQKYSYNSVLEDLREKNENVPNLYNIIISYQVTKAFNEKFGNYKTNWTFNNYCANDFNIHIYDINDTGDLIINYDYLIDKYSIEDVTDVHNRIINMINQILENNDINSIDIEIVTPEEKDKILNVFNNTKVDYPRDKTIVDLFEEQVEKTPDNVAVVFNDEKLTYRELNEKANSLARLLISKGMKENTICAIVLNRSIEMIVSILAVLKSGAAYIPIDPNYPKDRIEYILKDSNVKMVLTETEYISSLSSFNLNLINITDAEVFSLDGKNLNIKQNPEDLSYIIYTSGSTGKPKGVMLKKGSLMNLINYCNNYVEYLKNPLYRSVVSVTTVSFDIFIFETLISLQKGLKLVIASEDAQTSPILLNSIIEKENVEIMQTTPSRIKLLLNDFEHIPYLKNIKFLTLAGEQLPLSLVNELKSISENITIYNGYGPSETTVFSTFTDVTKHSQITIGKPLYNTQIYILDANKQLCPIGIAGELYIAGDGVGKGYINNPILTEKSFIKNIFNTDSIMYKTGDIGFYKENGEIVCLGRSDSQVKIRGLRIELSEIEQQLLKISNICNCCVVKKTSGNRDFLCAYYTKEGPVNEKNLRIALKQKLPQYMIPQYFVELKQLPYTPNGKIDKKSLPEPIIKNTNSKFIYRNDTDIKLANILKSLLGIDNINLSNSLLELGGDSLTAINLSAKIRDIFGVDVFVKDIISKDSLADLSDYISDLAVSDKKSFEIMPAEEAEFYPLSSAQKRIYYTSKMIGDENIVYNIPGAILVDSVLDKEKVEKCFKKIIKTQSSFRTSFLMLNDSIVQKINKSVNFSVNTYENKSTEIDNLINSFPKAFDLENAPLLRVELHYLDNGKTLLLLESHHIIMDGTSLEILINEFCKLYNNENLENLNIEYKDFAVWENKYLESDMVKEAENYWVNKFKDSEIPAINLPYDFSIPSSRSYKGNTVSKKISEKDFNKYITSAKKFGVSPYMFFLSTLLVLLYKYTGQEEIIIGSPVTGRRNNQLQDIIGMFVNNIAVDGKIDSSKKFAEFLNTIKQQVLNDLEYQDYPYNLLVKKLGISNDSTNNPLFDVMFAYQNANSNKLTLGNESVEIIKSSSGISKFNLSIEIEPDTRVVNLEYRTDLFKENTIDRLFEHFINALNIISDNNDVLIKDISIISEEEKNKILYEFNATAVNYPNDKSIIELFEEQVEKTPDNTALVFENDSLTYKELNEKANQLANFIKTEGFAPEDVICILLDKSIEMIIAILAILKNRCAYLPIDITYPQERIEYIIKDSKSKLLLTSKNQNTFNLPIKSIYIDLDNNNIYNSDSKANISMIRNSTDLAYIMYTSGSTGNPKGVMIENKSISRLIINNNYIKFQKNDRILQTGSIVFDACTFEIWGAFLNGLPLYIIKKEDLLDESIFHEYILKNKITVLWLTAPLFNQLCESNPHMFKTVRCLLTGGDVLSPKHINMVKLANPNLTIINGYGPTENTTFSCCYQIDKKYTDSIPIGGPIANSTCYVVSNDNNLQPIGIPGELWVGGDGVARGYFNNDKMTSEKFIYSNIVNTRIYKTGDLVKWDSDGHLIFLGRIDNQIKIRGFRVELSEISTVINSYEHVKEVYTIFDTVHNKKAICSYIVADKEIDFEDLKKYLGNQLPKYMIPTYFMQLDSLPINQNGKVNKKLLPKNFEIHSNNETVLPSSDIEKKLYNIFENILNVSNFSITDSFFSLGGDSLTVIRLETRIFNEFNVQISVAEIFDNPTIELLSKKIDTAYILKRPEHIKKCPIREFYPISSAQRRMYLTSNMDNNSTLYNITGGILLNKMPDINRIQHALNVLVSKHDILRSYFEIINDGTVVQKVKENFNVDIKILNADTNDIDKIFKTYQSSFDLSKAPLFNVFLITLPNNSVLLMLDIHHIIFDGTSFNIFMKDFANLYNEQYLPDLEISYKDFAVWEEEQILNNCFAESKNYWLKQFDKNIPILNMPTTYPRPANKSFKGTTYVTQLSRELTQKVKDFSNKNNITPYMLMLSAYYILLYKYTGQEEIIVGSPISGRTHQEIEPLLGMFVNSLPLKNTIHSNLKVKEFLDDTKKYCTEAFMHQDYPFDLLVNDLNLSQDSSRNPLFDTMFIYQNNSYPSITLDNIDAKYCIPKSNTSKFDLSLEVLPLNDNWNISIEYCTKLYDDNFIIAFSKHYINVLNNIISCPDTTISNISIIDEIERNKLLYEFNNTNMIYPKNKTISNLFEDQVNKTPNNIAIVFGDTSLTFKELNEKANQLAHYLESNNINQESTVGIMLSRSLEIMIAILAVLKVGACYIPIDPALPNKRINYMISNSDVSTILTNFTPSTEINVSDIINVSLDNTSIYIGNTMNLNKNINVESPAYMIYTSGSTGIPKGVILKHKSLVNLATYLNETVEFLKDEYSNMPIASITTISFDIFIFETLICLQRGLKIIFANESEQNTPNLLDDLINKNDVKAIQMTPSRMSIFINNKNIMPHLNNLKYIVLAGEALPKELLNQIKEIGDIKVYNGYGPSETTVFSTFTDVTNYNNITIGTPLYNTRIYILDKDKNICPVGIPGEIYIAGDGVGIGYCNNNEITQERFMQDILNNSDNMYKTGDLGKYLSNGEIYYIGRIDNQIKIRGLRIELDEIENCILKYPHIDKCIITSDVDNNSRQFIVAYLTVTDRISTNKLRMYLKTLLPKYMIPSYFVILDKLPYLNNGKINKKALPKPDLNAICTEKVKYVAPSNRLELQITNVFQSLLSISPIGIDDNFFELGGDSLLAINLQVELLKLNLNITYSDIFMYPTVRELSNKISSSDLSKNNQINTDDFSNFNNILDNTCLPPDKIEDTPIGNILITGTTGFLGIHILDNFLQNEDGIAYCLTRPEPGLTLENKLLNKLHFYFGNKYDNYIGNRIIIVNGDLTQENLNLTKDKIENIFNDISCIINCAAKVSHYGNYKDFKDINVTGTENLLKLGLQYNKRFYQISTLSVSGNSLVDQSYIEQSFEKDVIFKENNFYINQSLDNVYVRSKFEAEKLVLQYILKGLNGYIFRVGNLMNRYSDGKFQPNVEENAYISRLISLSYIGCIPDYMLNAYMEFTPIDCCANAIITLMKHPTKLNRIFHLYDHNHVNISDFINELINYIPFKVVSNDDFIDKINNIFKETNSNKILSGILRDFDSDKKLVYESKVKLNSDFTIEYLSKIGFKWPKIDDCYIKKFLTYYNSIGYLNSKEDK